MTAAAIASVELDKLGAVTTGLALLLHLVVQPMTTAVNA